MSVKTIIILFSLPFLVLSFFIAHAYDDNSWPAFNDQATEYFNCIDTNGDGYTCIFFELEYNTGYYQAYKTLANIQWSPAPAEVGFIRADNCITGPDGPTNWPTQCQLIYDGPVEYLRSENSDFNIDNPQDVAPYIMNWMSVYVNNTISNTWLSIEGRRVHINNFWPDRYNIGLGDTTNIIHWDISNAGWAHVTYDGCDSGSFGIDNPDGYVQNGSTPGGYCYSPGVIHYHLVAEGPGNYYFASGPDGHTQVAMDFDINVGGSCGDGIVTSPEQCDNDGANGACPAVCSSSCTWNSCEGGEPTPTSTPTPPPGGGSIGPCINGLATATDPTVDGYWLDLCYAFSSGCGKPAGDAWCQANGFPDGSSGSPPWTYKEPTKTIGTGQICTGAGCGAITSLQCICATPTPTPTPIPTPTVSISANPGTVNYGGSSTITWSSANTTSCTASGDWSGSKSLSGSQSTGALTLVKTYIYTLTCTGAGGSTSGTANVVVNASQPSVVGTPTVTEPDYCVSGPAVTIGWTYSDPAGSPQSAYQVQVSDTGNFNNPIFDSGKIQSSSNSYFTGQGILQSNTTYKARVRVWNGYDVVSLWSNETSSWKTPSYAYPQVNFTWTANSISENPSPPLTKPVDFTDQTIFEGNPNGRRWSWTFGDGGSSTLQNPSKTYSAEGTYYVTLTATDNANQSCSKTRGPLIIQKPIPRWREVAPK